MKKKKFKHNRRLQNAFIAAYRKDARTSQKSKCFYCFEILTSKNTTADHKIPKKFHGSNEKENIVAACEVCNTRKGHKSVKEFQKEMNSFPKGKDIKSLVFWSNCRLNKAIDKSEKRLNKIFGFE